MLDDSHVGIQVTVVNLKRKGIGTTLIRRRNINSRGIAGHTRSTGYTVRRRNRGESSLARVSNDAESQALAIDIGCVQHDGRRRIFIRHNRLTVSQRVRR